MSFGKRTVEVLVPDTMQIETESLFVDSGSRIPGYSILLLI